MDERAVVDRVVDGTHAVLLVGDRQEELVVPAGDLPAGAEPGTWLVITWTVGEIKIDAERTAEMRDRIESKLQRLRQRGQPSQGQGEVSGLG